MSELSPEEKSKKFLQEIRLIYASKEHQMRTGITPSYHGAIKKLATMDETRLSAARRLAINEGYIKPND